ncbi:hypothetical protein DL93DRAFT_1308312 [Clavulina sp. PMI_390]|nr:hypothetical protein DL93DRAFT_1308312 [Clavulina sp. PMI_390]
MCGQSSAARPLVPPSECGPTEAPRAPTKVSQAPTLEPSEVEFEAQPSSREAEAALQRPVTPTHSDHYAQQKRKSVFDMLESTPSSTSQASIPNIVTSWDDPPKRARASILAPKSRPLSGIRTSRMTSGVAASEATFKVPLPPQTGSLTEGEPSEKASRTTRTEAEVTKRASGLRTVASSLINKDRSRPAKTGPSDPAPRTEEEKPASSTRTGGTLLRRSRSTLSSSTAVPVVAEKVAPRSRPTSVIIGKPRPSELQPTNAAGPMPSSLLSLLQRPPSQASQRASERGRAGGAGETATAAPESRRTQNRTSLIQSVSQRTTRPASPERKPRARVEEEAPKSRLQDWANDVAKASQQPESDGQGGCEASGPAATLARKTSVRDMASAGTLRRTKTSQSQLRREEPTSVARPGSPRKDGNSTVRSRVMERPALSGIKQWAADVASVAPRSEDVEVDQFAQLKSTSADAETIKGLTRKRSFKEPSATSAPLATGLSASTLRPTKTTISSTTTAPKPTEARPSGASKTATLRPRSSIYSIRDGKIAQSVDVLPLAQDSKPPPSAFQNGSTVRRRPSSMILYASKAGSMSTSAVNDVPSSMSGSQRTTTGASSAAGTASSRPSLLRRPSMTFAPPSSFAGPPPSASSAVAKGLSRVGSTLLRSSKSRPSMSTR